MALYNFIWWFVFFIIAIVAQSILSGIDFLLVGVIIALQERRIGQLIWVIFAAILLQEGVGTLPFGSVILIIRAISTIRGESKISPIVLDRTSMNLLTKRPQPISGVVWTLIIGKAPSSSTECLAVNSASCVGIN